MSSTTPKSRSNSTGTGNGSSTGTSNSTAPKKTSSSTYNYASNTSSSTDKEKLPRKTSSSTGGSGASTLTKPRTSSNTGITKINKGVSRLKVDDDSGSPSPSPSPKASAPSPTTKVTPVTATDKAAVRRRLSIMGGTDQAALDGSDPNKAGAKSSQAAVTRRRLSIMGGAADASTGSLDGASQNSAYSSNSNNNDEEMGSGKKEIVVNKAEPKKLAVQTYATLSKVGFVPFNANKVNQDRFSDVTNFAGHSDRALFAVFDGHGAVGHEVSQFCCVEVPKSLAKQPHYANGDIHGALDRAFLETHERLATSGQVDCTFSGTTAIVVYIDNGRLFSANAGDSRAVLARQESNGSYTAIALSSDHKPERPDEKERIIRSKGRVEACKGAHGEDIGPSRVWLLKQDVPGLAMTRSIGDLVAASVGVSAKPEIWERVLTPNDKFMILASDGVWEFISNEEAVNIVLKHSTPQDAVKAIVDESVRRWHQEEEVVDDITAVLVYF